jgi:hypothetical protein
MLTPTGRTRYRVQKRLFRQPLLILQVEIRNTTYTALDIRWWQDAQLQDISMVPRSIVADEPYPRNET